MVIICPFCKLENLASLIFLNFYIFLRFQKKLKIMSLHSYLQLLFFLENIIWNITFQMLKSIQNTYLFYQYISYLSYNTPDFQFFPLTSNFKFILGGNMEGKWELRNSIGSLSSVIVRHPLVGWTFLSSLLLNIVGRKLQQVCFVLFSKLSTDFHIHSLVLSSELHICVLSIINQYLT